MQGIELKEESEVLTEGDSGKKVEAKLKIDEAMRDAETFWSQRSRLLWLKEGDRCTKLFHKVMNNSPANYSLGRLIIDGMSCDDPDIIKSHVLSYY